MSLKDALRRTGVFYGTVEGIGEPVQPISGLGAPRRVEITADNGEKFIYKIDPIEWQSIRFWAEQRVAIFAVLGYVVNLEDRSRKK
ncbi:MAG TPA: hypothetical protein VF209_02535 [Patescibacteria group bacterium]